MDIEPSVNILLVSNREESLHSLEAALEGLGAGLVPVASPAEAVARVRETEFAAVLLDQPAPDAVRLIREAEQSGPTPILCLTSSPAGAPAAEAVDYLAHPFTWEALRGRVSALVSAFRRGRRVEHASAASLRQREAELTDFMENAALGLHWVAGDGTILWANGAELELLGYTREEYIGHHIAEFHADAEVIGDILHRLTCNETLRSYEARLRCKDGSIRHVLISSNVLWDGDRFVHTRCLTRDITERVRAEELLRAKEAELRTITDAVPVFMAYVGADGRFQRVNRGFAEWAGVSREALRGRMLSEVIGDAMWQVVEPHVREALSGNPARFEHRVDTSQGERRWFQVTYTPHFGEDGRVQGFVALAQDIHERKQAEEARQFLMEASELLTSSLDYHMTLERLTRLAVPRMADWCAVDMLDPDGSIRRLAVAHVDPAKIELAYELQRRYPPAADAPYGLPQVLRTGEAAFFPTIPDELLVQGAQDEEHLRMARALGLVSGMVVPLKARGRIVGAITLVTAESGRTYAQDDLALAQDLARRAAMAVDHAALYEAAQQELKERGALERQLRASEEQFRALVEQAPLSIQVLSPTGETVQVNPAWERLWGVTLEQLQSVRYNILQDGQLVAKGLMPYIRLAFAGEAAVIPPVDYDRVETLGELVTDDQPKRWVRANIYPVHDESGTLQKVVLIHEDYTDRHLLEEELKERVAALAENARQKDQFLAMLAHELRNPIGVISNAVEVLGQISSQEERPRKTREIIARQVRHLTRMVEDLLDVSRLTRGLVELRKQRVLLSELMAHVVESCSSAMEMRQHRFQVLLPPEPVQLEVDPARFEQIVSNVLNNATKYTEPGGEIRLTATLEPADGHPWLVLRVRDNGIGMDARLLPRVFDLFTQADQSLDRSQGGLGIGLTLVRALVEMHGGTVSARSEGPGKGSEFTLRLPAIRPGSKIQSPESSNVGVEPLDLVAETPDLGPEPPAPRRRVLVVDDSRDAAETLAELLEGWGHTVRAVHSGPAALELMDDFQPEVVLCDVGMPGMNGYELARRLRSLPETNGLLLIALTGYGQETDRQEAREAGFDLHLTKPAEPELLRQALAAR